MSWTRFVRCTGCKNVGNDMWYVVSGVWTCECGKPMTISEIATYHASLT